MFAPPLARSDPVPGGAARIQRRQRRDSSCPTTNPIRGASFASAAGGNAGWKTSGLGPDADPSRPPTSAGPSAAGANAVPATRAHPGASCCSAASGASRSRATDPAAFGPVEVSPLGAVPPRRESRAMNRAPAFAKPRRSLLRYLYDFWSRPGRRRAAGPVPHPHRPDPPAVAAHQPGSAPAPWTSGRTASTRPAPRSTERPRRPDFPAARAGQPPPPRRVLPTDCAVAWRDWCDVPEHAAPTVRRPGRGRRVPDHRPVYAHRHGGRLGALRQLQPPSVLPDERRRFDDALRPLLSPVRPVGRRLVARSPCSGGRRSPGRSWSRPGRCG